jgi:hypothetical protein
MIEKLTESIENDEISQLEIIELVETCKKLVTLNILEDNTFQELLDNLGITNPEPNKFVLDEDCYYELP